MLPELVLGKRRSFSRFALESAEAAKLTRRKRQTQTTNYETIRVIDPGALPRPRGL
jgi:hypothetical protein